MTPILLTAPALEPVSLTQAKTWLRTGHDSDDELIGALITSARLVVEAHARLVMIEQTWRIIADDWPLAGVVELPIRPVISLAAIRVVDAAGNMMTVPAPDYLLSPAPTSPAVHFIASPPAPARPIAGIEIDVQAGFGPTASDVPEPLRQAIRLLVARWYENRGDAATDVVSVPAQIAALIAPWRSVRLS